MKSFLFVSLLATLAAAQGTANNNNYLGTTPRQRFIIDLNTTYAAIEGAIQEANRISVPMNIAVTDPSGLLVGFVRMDNAFLGSTDIAIKKARTVAVYNGAYTTADFYPLAQPGGPLYAIEETNGGLIVFGGGVPLNCDGIFYGAIGVSGGSVDQDIQVASAGARAIGAYVAPVNSSAT